MSRLKTLSFLIGTLCCLGCNEIITSPDPALLNKSIDRLLIFVRDWPNEYVEIDLTRKAGQSTLLIYRPPQPGVPRVLLDSIGPNAGDPPEIVELLETFNVWAMADSNAAGAACNTKGGEWGCTPTFNDYSLVMQVIRRGVSRSQRYTRLNESTSNRTARALGDFVFAMARKRARSTQLLSDQAASPVRQ